LKAGNRLTLADGCFAGFERIQSEYGQTIHLPRGTECTSPSFVTGVAPPGFKPTRHSAGKRSSGLGAASPQLATELRFPGPSLGHPRVLSGKLQGDSSSRLVPFCQHRRGPSLLKVQWGASNATSEHACTSCRDILTAGLRLGEDLCPP